MLHFQCPSCQHELKVSDDKAGKKGRCPKCNQQLVVPSLPKEAVDEVPMILVHEEAPAPPHIVTTPTSSDVPSPRKRNPRILRSMMIGGLVAFLIGLGLGLLIHGLPAVASAEHFALMTLYPILALPAGVFLGYMDGKYGGFFNFFKDPSIQRSRWVALALAIPFGILAFDRFYLGDWKLGLLKVCTGGGLYLWWFVDIYLIATGKLKDAHGNALV